MPDFERQGQRARQDAYIETIGFIPLVTFEDRKKWALFSTTNSSNWLEEGKDIVVPPFIWKEGEDPAQSETIAKIPDDNILMAPLWQTSPLPFDARVINFNLFSESLYQFLFGAMTETKQTALSGKLKGAATATAS